VMQEYRLAIEDRRGRLTGLERSDEGLLVSVNAVNHRLRYCAVHTKSLAGSHHKDVQPVISENTMFRLEGPAQDLDVWLMADDGEVLDRYAETPAHASWG